MPPRNPTIRLPPPLPPPKIDMKALRSVSSVLLGIVAVTPVGKGMLTLSTTLADTISGNKDATNYVNNGKNNNGTVSMLVPGGLLLQNSANLIHPGATDMMNKFLPDPKAVIVKSLVTQKKPDLLSLIATPTVVNSLQSIPQPKYVVWGQLGIKSSYEGMKVL